MLKKPREPKATANHPVGSSWPNAAPRLCRGTACSVGCPTATPRCSTESREQQLQCLLRVRRPTLMSSHGRAPQSPCSPLHTPQDLQPCSHHPFQEEAFALGGVPREAARPCPGAVGFCLRIGSHSPPRLGFGSPGVWAAGSAPIPMGWIPWQLGDAPSPHAAFGALLGGGAKPGQAQQPPSPTQDQAPCHSSQAIRSYVPFSACGSGDWQ